jgi:hypothetical protein
MMFDFAGVTNEISSWLAMPADDVDQMVRGTYRARVLDQVMTLNRLASADEPDAFYHQQRLLSRIYQLSLSLAPGEPTAEGSVVLHEISRLLEAATAAKEDSYLSAAALAGIPTSPAEYVSWLKNLAKTHPVYKHPYYHEFIRDRAGRDDLRRHMILESVLDSRFDDLLALMQVGTAGVAKMEIAGNFWDEMGNGRHEEVHSTLFDQIFQVFEVTKTELDEALTATALLTGNLAVMLCRYRHRYPEAVGYLGMTEWLVPDRFVQAVHAWERLGLPEVGIVYHRLHITVDAQHAAGWFHNVVAPAATSAAMRLGIARGTLWRLNSSARYLDQRMAEEGYLASGLTSSTL